ncbi:MAG: Nif3-like dinuclear metal center hexameric protein [Ginsengibacter sp.]
MHTDDIFDDKQDLSDRGKTWQRREFVTTIAKAIGAAPLLSVPGFSMAIDNTHRRSSLTVQEVIDLILSSIPGAPFPKTVDTIKSGNPSQQVTGIVTTMFATNKVIEQTISTGANFIIAHEPTFYNHLDDVVWLASDEVYQNKKKLLEKNKIVVWRFHDGIHAHKPDGVLMGVLNALGWQQYYNADKPHIIILPTTTLGDVINHLKDKLGIQHLKVIGDLSQKCSRIALLPGAAGGMSQIGVLQKEKPDLLICGEINEWETAEYVRDMRHMGSQTSLIVTGHSVSEEPGLEWLVNWLQPQIPGIKITHISSYDPFEWP